MFGFMRHARASGIADPGMVNHTNSKLGAPAQIEMQCNVFNRQKLTVAIGCYRPKSRPEMSMSFAIRF
jgi:hypothetical protein